jgi:CarD family transcriptional regulator
MSEIERNDNVMMYRVNDAVLYGTQGVCKITEISEKNLCGKPTEYYVLKPVQDDKATIFVPINSEIASMNMHPVMSAEEVYTLIKNMPGADFIWIEEDVIRRNRYQEILTGGDRMELVKLIKTLHQHQQRQRDKGKGKEMPLAEKHMLKEAEKILHGEFAYVLNMKYEQVLPFIIEQMQVENRN